MKHRNITMKGDPQAVLRALRERRATLLRQKLEQPVSIQRRNRGQKIVDLSTHWLKVPKSKHELLLEALHPAGFSVSPGWIKRSSPVAPARRMLLVIQATDKGKIDHPEDFHQWRASSKEAA